MMRIFSGALVTLLPLLLAGACAAPKRVETSGTPGPPSSAETPLTTDSAKFELFLRHCREHYAEVDARIAKAGVRDAGYYQLPGFPYVRTDRLMSSYRNEVSGDVNTLGTWMLQLRENDSIARDIELANLGMPKYDRAVLLNDLRVCAVWLSYVELDDPPTFNRLIDDAQMPENPAPPQAATTFAQELSARQARIRQEFSAPLSNTKRSSALTLWQAGPSSESADVPDDFHGASRDELGRVGLLMNVWRALAAKHAPALLIETAGDYDRPGAPVLTASGPSVDASNPTVYYLPGYARVGNETLVQLNYFVWFSARPPQNQEDLEAGALDGLIWRVTLDDDGRPLVYDSIRASGLDHLWFPVQILAPRPSLAAAERPLIPQKNVPQGDFVVRLQSATHDLQRLVATKGISPGDKRSYELRLYEDLMTLPAPDGGTHSLFAPDGAVSGSERPDSPLYRASGVPRAGAMRQWGNHRIALLGPHYFDDPRLIEELFVTPIQQASTEPEAVQLRSVP